MFLSTDNGGSWTQAGLVGSYVNTLTSSGIKLFAGTINNGIFLSTNDGTSWIAVNDGLINTNIWSLAASSDNLFAGTNGSAVWRRPLSEMITSIERISNGLPKQFSLNQNYPDPFNPSTTISFTIPERSDVTLKVFDILGREVATIVSGEMPAGTFSRQWNATKMASGIYFYRLQAGLFTQTKRLVLLK